MMCAIEAGRVRPSKEMLYQTAVVSESLARHLQCCNCRAVQAIEAGTVVAVRFAWHGLDGEAIYYFGPACGCWVGMTHASGLHDFCLQP